MPVECEMDEDESYEQELGILLEREDRRRERCLAIAEKILPAPAMESLRGELESAMYACGFAITKTVKGRKTASNDDEQIEMWLHGSKGMDDDGWEGDIYFRISERHFLKWTANE